VRKTLQYICLISISVIPSSAFAQAKVDLTGLWRLQSGGFQIALKTSNGEAPPLLPEAAKIYRKNRAAYEAGNLSYDRTTTICLSPGMPRMMLLPYQFQIIQRPQQLAFIFEWNNRYRLVDMSRKPPIVDDLSYMGTASGRVEADQVVIETQGLIDTTFLDASGMPHSEELRLTERYRLKEAGKTLVNEISIEDSKTFSRPWKAIASYRRVQQGTEIQEDVCRERVTKGGPAFNLETWK
jgi:hypothetical protein